MSKVKVKKIKIKPIDCARLRKAQSPKRNPPSEAALFNPITYPNNCADRATLDPPKRNTLNRSSKSSEQSELDSEEARSPKKSIWNQWLAGLIDGDGYLSISKDGYCFLEITMGLKDEVALSQIKQKLGGSLKLRSNANAIRYRLKSKNEMIELINRINGEIRNSVRVEQLKIICNKLDITYKPAPPLTKENGYIAGLFDADGSITISVSKTSAENAIFTGVEGKIKRLSAASGFHQLTLKITNKYEANLSFLLSSLNIGRIICDNSRDCAKRNPPKTTGPIFHWYLQKKVDILNFLEYIKKYPLRSGKKKRLFLIKNYFDLFDQKAHLAPEGTLLNKAWKRFCSQWFNSGS